MIHFVCECRNALFFENSTCLNCGREVGYDLDSNRMVVLGGNNGFRRCQNGVQYQACNWAISGSLPDTLCPACQLNRTIPNLQIEGNRSAWARLETAKRRVVYTLDHLGLRPISRAIDPNGVAFDFLAPNVGEEKVLTGHLDGVITINLLEADDAYRERQRTNLGEPYRTLVGHFRHELGHYYWDRFFKGRPNSDPLMQSLRELFGDETRDYGQALQTLSQQGPPAGWATSFISSYASCHAWEDWAETWAQYLHILDAAETATHFGFDSRKVPIPFKPFTKDVVGKESDDRLKFLQVLNDWAKLTPALNEVAASLGHPGVYPFILSEMVARKLYFINDVVRRFGGAK